MENEENKNISLNLDEKQLSQVSGGLTVEEIIQNCYDYESTTRNDLEKMKSEMLNSQMNAAKEAYEESLKDKDKDKEFASNLKFGNLIKTEN